MATSAATGGPLAEVLAETLADGSAVFGAGGPPQAAKRTARAAKAAGTSAWRIRVMGPTLPRSPLRRDPDARKKTLRMMDSNPPSDPQPRARSLGVREERVIEIVADDGTVLDGRLAVPEGASRAVVLAHPHPLYGGSMEDPVTVAIGRLLGERGIATLRFDFRGVGRSEGRYAGGQREVNDVLGALRTMSRFVSGPIAVAGYSFGSWVALKAARRTDMVERLALVAPAASLFEYEGTPRYERPLAIAIGDRDNFCDAPRARVLASRLGASIAVLSGEDHFFARSRRRLAELLAPFLAGESDRIDEGALG